MVNYCCVVGCGRNSKVNKHLNYYTLPKERGRQVEWLKAAGREDLLTKEQTKLSLSHRFCSRHFAPPSIKNRHLCPDAVPTLFLPGSNDEDEEEESPQPHSGIVCNSCTSRIVGFRYKCVSCADYDLCTKCEMLEVHPHHYMLRIPKPMKFKLGDNLVKKWRKFLKEERVPPNCDDSSGGDTSDDEPITKYSKNYDSGVDLSEDVKNRINKEVNRVLKLKSNKSKSKKCQKNEKKRSGEDIQRQSKKLKSEESGVVTHVPTGSTPGVVFADVNDIKDSHIVDLKSEFSMLQASDLTDAGADNATTAQQPVLHMKLSEDLSELMVEVLASNQKTVYKYTDTHREMTQ